MQKDHVYYFDYLRLISALGVVYMHVASGPLRGELGRGWHAMNIITSLAFTAVPLFIMMSGYLILSSEKTADISFLLKKRLPRLVIPLAGWTVVAVIWRLSVNDSFSLRGLYDGLLSALAEPAWTHLWYMYTLIALYVISPFVYGALHSLDRKGHIFVLSLIGLISLRTILEIFLPDFLLPYLNVDILNKLTVWNSTLATFVLGYYLGRFRQRIPNKVLVPTAAAVLAVIAVGTYLLTAADGSFNQTFQSQYSGFEIILAACIFLIFKQSFNRSSRLLRAVPIIPLSLSIYLMHNILLSMMSRSIPIVTFWDTVWVTLLNFVICFVAMKTAATVRPLCYIATGMTYRTACETCNWVYTYRRAARLIGAKRRGKRADKRNSAE